MSNVSILEELSFPYVIHVLSTIPMTEYDGDTYYRVLHSEGYFLPPTDIDKSNLIVQLTTDQSLGLTHLEHITDYTLVDYCGVNGEDDLELREASKEEPDNV